MSGTIEDSIDFGKAEQPRRRAQKLAYVGATALALVLAFPEHLAQTATVQQAASVTAGERLPDQVHTATLQFEPGHSVLIFTQTGARLTKMPRRKRIAPASVSVGVAFTDIHCEQHSVYAKTEVDVNPVKLYFIGSTALPANSMTLNCLLRDNLVGSELRNNLSFMGVPYGYDAHFSSPDNR